MGDCRCHTCPIPEGWPQLTDEQWEQLAPLLPQGTGSRAETTRRQVNGMLYALETGCPWRLLPTQFGPTGLVETRFRRWASGGVLRTAYAHLYPPKLLAQGRTVVISNSYVKVHRSAAGARAG
ncbi:MAG: transposase [Chloroflexi bacterium]|nr:transposase [Chloroflexota bacterium]MYD47037.1 transposase [Chloroflexota bacterium]MYE66860.1 transposase [Acidimicrobiia bacterium]